MTRVVPASETRENMPVACSRLTQQSLKQKNLEPSQHRDTGFQQPGFLITIMVGFRIPLAGFRIPQTEITWIPGYLTWGDVSIFALRNGCIQGR